MFSIQQKRDISDAVQKILRATLHPELPISGEISFDLHVRGAESWSYADIKNNGAVGDPGMNPHNELMASIPESEARGLIEEGKALSEAATGFPPMPDPRNTPEEFFSGRWLAAYKEMVKEETAQLVDRMNSLVKAVEGFAQDTRNSETRIDRLDKFLTPIIEDDLIRYHGDKIREIQAALGATADSDANALLSLPDRMRNLETAVRQLGNANG
jgi:hypothetical protein